MRILRPGFALAVLLAAPAFAQEPWRPRLALEASVGVAAPDLDIEPARRGTLVESGTEGLDVGLAIAASGRRLQLRAALHRHECDVVVARDTAPVPVTERLRRERWALDLSAGWTFLPDARVRPQVYGGGGALILRATNAEEFERARGTHGSLHAGTAVEIDLGRRLVLRPDVRARVAEGDEAAVEWQYGVGLAVRLGRLSTASGSSTEAP